MTVATATLADRYSPASDDETAYLNAIARRNRTWALFQAADALLEAARRSGRELAPYVRNYNQHQYDWEWAERDLVRARVWYRDEIERRRAAG